MSYCTAQSSKIPGRKEDRELMAERSCGKSGGVAGDGGCEHSVLEVDNEHTHTPHNQQYPQRVVKTRLRLITDETQINAADLNTPRNRATRGKVTQ